VDLTGLADDGRRWRVLADYSSAFLGGCFSTSWSTVAISRQTLLVFHELVTWKWNRSYGFFFHFSVRLLVVPTALSVNYLLCWSAMQQSISNWGIRTSAPKNYGKSQKNSENIMLQQGHFQPCCLRDMTCYPTLSVIHSVIPHSALLSPSNIYSSVPKVILPRWLRSDFCET
jgi:hypothetical protein